MFVHMYIQQVTNRIRPFAVADVFRCLCVAVCCSVLQCVAVCCSVLQCVAVRCSVLHCAAVCCTFFAVCPVHFFGSRPLPFFWVSTPSSRFLIREHSK